jgi:uncharacterized protein YdhG (YjbR/CyaY superfamily)
MLCEEAKTVENPIAATFEEYLARLDEGMVETTRQVFEVMRAVLPDAEEAFDGGTALLVVNGKPVTGIAARDGAYEIYVPQPAINAEFSSKLGKVEGGKDCIRFTKLGDVSEAQLRRMIRNQASA